MASTDCLHRDIAAVDIAGDTKPQIIFVLASLVTGIVGWIQDYFAPPWALWQQENPSIRVARIAAQSTGDCVLDHGNSCKCCFWICSLIFLLKVCTHIYTHTYFICNLEFILCSKEWRKFYFLWSYFLNFKWQKVKVNPIQVSLDERWILH